MRASARGLAACLVALLPAAVAAAPAPARVVFDARFGAKGVSRYAKVVNPHRMAVVRDPVRGSARKVLRLTVHDGDDDGFTPDPRAQLQTPGVWDAGEEYYVGLSLLFPPDWPDIPRSGGAVTLASVYGPPHNGPGPNRLMVDRTGEERQLLKWDSNSLPEGFSVPLVRGRWMDLVMRIKLSPDPGVGFWEMWSNSGRGWQRLAVDGRTRLYAATIDRANNGGQNSARISHYRRRGMWPVATHYVATHRIGTSFKAVAPRSYRGRRKAVSATTRGAGARAAARAAAARRPVGRAAPLP